MNDIKGLLGRALDGSTATDVDPHPDLMRGRRLLRRRRSALLAGGAAVVLAATLTPLALNGVPGGTAWPGPATAASPAVRPSVALVAYEGPQAPGYEVSWVPEGWVIQGGTPSSLVFVPAGGVEHDGSPFDELNTFVGKLVVLSESSASPDAATDTSLGTSQQVDGRPGRVWTEDGVQQLRYQAADGRGVVIQAPESLGWSGEEIARFAAGVTVLDHAEPGNG